MKDIEQRYGGMIEIDDDLFHCSEYICNNSVKAVVYLRAWPALNTRCVKSGRRALERVRVLSIRASTCLHAHLPEPGQIHSFYLEYIDFIPFLAFLNFGITPILALFTLVLLDFKESGAVTPP